MALGGKNDALLAQTVVTSQAMKKLCTEAWTARLEAAGGLREAQLDLDEAIRTTAGTRQLQRVLAKVCSAAASMLGNAPVEFNGLVADVYEAMVPALRQLGHEEVAAELSDAATQLKATC